MQCKLILQWNVRLHLNVCRCISYDSADLKICPLDCEHSCHPLGSGWVCLCYAGYKLTGDLMTCEFDSNIQVYDEADLMGH